MKTDEELLLEIMESLGGKATREKIRQAVENRAWHGSGYTTLNVDFDRVMVHLLAVQEVVIIPDGEYQTSKRVYI